MKCIVLFVCRKYVLDMSGGIEDIGAPRWQLALCLLLAWTLTFLSLSKGVKSTGKVTLKQAYGKEKKSSNRHKNAGEWSE